MCLLPKTAKNLFFFFSLCWLLDKFGRKFKGLLYRTIEEVGCQLLNILVIADGGRRDRLKETSLQPVCFCSEKEQNVSEFTRGKNSAIAMQRAFG